MIWFGWVGGVYRILVGRGFWKHQETTYNIIWHIIADNTTDKVGQNTCSISLRAFLKTRQPHILYQTYLSRIFAMNENIV
jgi:hypothetical protein